MSAPRVCAVVVTFNRAALLARGLEGLMAQHRPPDEILVVDNASTDSTADLLAGSYPEASVHRLASNSGSSGGFSEGVRLAHEMGFDWLWLLDDDVVAEPACLKELLEVAVASGKKVVVPRRRAADGAYPRNEAIIDERMQTYRAPVSSARWVGIDIFTFEGPLIHRSVVDRVGVPNSRFFITADDTEFSVRVYQEMGPLAGALANHTAVNRLLPSEGDVTMRSGLKHAITGDSEFVVSPDEQYWKHGYYLRNRHLIWKKLGWRRRRIRQLVIHAGYIVTDVIESARRGWDWRLRLRINTHALILGLLGRDGAFINPAEYRAIRARRAKRRA